MNKIYLPLVISLLSLSACSTVSERSSSLLSNKDIIGTWAVKLIENKPTLEHSQTELTFSPDNRLSGKASCNRLSASYLLTSEENVTALTFSLSAGTRMMCPHVLMEQEERFFNAMTKVKQVKLNQGDLVLLDNTGKLVFKASKVNTHD
jgi:heat shock protein HslJ